MPTTSFSRGLWHRRYSWRSESTTVFCTINVMYHALWRHLSSLPYQFSIFRGWQPCTHRNFDWGTTSFQTSNFSCAEPNEKWIESKWKWIESNRGGGGGGDTTPIPRVLFSYPYDPPIYEITSGCKVAALFWREAPRWTPDAIWFPFSSDEAL